MVAHQRYCMVLLVLLYAYNRIDPPSAQDSASRDPSARNTRERSVHILPFRIWFGLEYGNGLTLCIPLRPLRPTRFDIEKGLTECSSLCRCLRLRNVQSPQEARLHQ